MARPGRIFFPLDVNWYDEWGHELSDDAALLWVVAACACKRMLADGRLTFGQIRRIAPESLAMEPDRLSSALNELCACEGCPVEKDGQHAFAIRGWASWNDLASDIEAMSAGGRFGNHVKWHVRRHKTDPECEFCRPESGGDIAPDSGPESKSRVDTDTDTDTDTELNTLATAKPPRGRKRDLLFEALCETQGIADWKSATRDELGKVRKAHSALKAIGATPEEVRHRTQVWRERWPNVTLSALGLESNWSRFDPTSRVDSRPAFTVNGR